MRSTRNSRGGEREGEEERSRETERERDRDRSSGDVNAISNPKSNGGPFLSAEPLFSSSSLSLSSSSSASSVTLAPATGSSSSAFTPSTNTTLEWLQELPWSGINGGPGAREMDRERGGASATSGGGRRRSSGGSRKAGFQGHIVHTLRGHSTAVVDLAVYAETNILSASLDGTCR